MKSTNLNSKSRRGFAAMDPEKRRAAAKKGGNAIRKVEQLEQELSEVPTSRGFAALDKEKRKQIAKLGGSTSRRNRIDWKRQAPLL